MTPVYPSETFSRLAGRQVFLKAENLQRTGSFKIRGAFNTIATLGEAERRAGVVAASAGQPRPGRRVGGARGGHPGDDLHAAGRADGEGRGDALVRRGHASSRARASRRRSRPRRRTSSSTGATFVHAFEDERVIAGQGTIGLELAEQVPDAETVVIPIGGGGLAAGIALALRELSAGRARRRRRLPAGLHDRRRDRREAPRRARRRRSSTELLDDIVSVVGRGDLARRSCCCSSARSSSSRAPAPSGSPRSWPAGCRAAGPVAVVLSGGNIDATTLISVLRHGLTQAGRYLVDPAAASRTVPGELRKRARPGRARPRQRRLGRPSPRRADDERAPDRDRARRLDARRGALRRSCSRRSARPATRSSGSARHRRLAKWRLAPPAGSRMPSRRSSARSAAPRSPRADPRARSARSSPSSSPTSSARPRAPSGSTRRTCARCSRPYHDAAAARARAARRHGREVHRRRGRGGVRRAGRARGRPGARGAGGARDPGRDRGAERGRPALELQVRIGVNTGEALVVARRAAGEGEGMVVGRRRQHRRAAPVGGAARTAILVGEHDVPRDRARDRVPRIEPRCEAKGKAEPVRVWEALERAGALRPGSSTGSGRAPLVGRERELDAARDALARVRSDERSPQLVTLVGVPGIGKSRLVWELCEVVDADPELIIWRQGRSLPYGEGVAFWALGEIVKAQAGILESDSADDAERKLGAGRSATCFRTNAERPGSSGICGRSSGSPEAETSTPIARARRSPPGGASSRRSPSSGPAVLVFEDLHWADDDLLDFVDDARRLSSTAVPLLVVCTARPELLERRPGWGGGKPNALTLSLAPLVGRGDRAPARRAARADACFPAETQAALLAARRRHPALRRGVRADARRQAGRDDRRSRRRCRGSSPPGSTGCPRSEKAAPPGRGGARQGVLDRRACDARRDRAVAVLEERAARARAQGVRAPRAAIGRRRRAGSTRSCTRSFATSAYGQIPRASRAPNATDGRRTGSRRCPRIAPKTAPRCSHYHLESAIEYGSAAGQSVDDLRPRAVAALREAGDRAWALGVPHAALGLYERARSLHPDAADDPYLLLRLGRALLTVRFEGDAELAQAASALASSDSAAAAEAEMLHGELIWHRGDQESSFRHFDRAASLVEDLPLSLQTGWVVSQLARFLALAGRNREGGELAERTIAMARRAR